MRPDHETDNSRDERAATTASPGNKIRLILALVATVVAGYFAGVHYSAPEAQAPIQNAASFAAPHPKLDQSRPGTSVAPVGELLLGLKQRLQQHPDDVQGWVLLSKSYYHLNRLPQARASFDKAVALGYDGSWRPLPRIDAHRRSTGAPTQFGSTIDFGAYDLSRDKSATRAGPTSAQGNTAKNATNGLKREVAVDPG